VGPDPRGTGAPVSLAGLLGAATRRLAGAGVASPRVDAELLAAAVLGVGRGALASVGAVDDEDAEWLAALVERRAAREPLQHLVGTAAFRHLELAVGPGVFTPRLETELVAQVAIDEVHRLVALEPGRVPVVVDLGTGSGAIALAVATEASEAVVHAVEVDPAPYAWADRNVAALDAAGRVHLHLGDMSGALHELDGTVDVVVSNPPYVPLGTSLPPEVADGDPLTALFGGPDGLDGPRAVLAAGARLLQPGGLLVVEHDDGHGESLPALAAGGVDWDAVSDHADLAGRPRFLTARRTGRPGAGGGA
jgi:release factor glutamine methyltransferase